MKLIFYISIATFITVIAANIIYLELLKHHNTSIVNAIAYSAPILVLLFSMVLFKERLSTLSIIGVFLVICGTIIVGLSHKKAA